MGTIPTIDSEVLATWLERDEAVLIDVREEPFYRAAHIPGARSIPFGRLEPRRRDPPVSALLPLLAAYITLAVTIGCGGSSPSEPAPQEAVFLVLSSAASGESFHVLVRNPQVIAEAESLVGQGNRKIVTGRLARGHGGFNQPWSWHMVPETVSFAGVTIELCDGRPSDVESDLDYWVETVGQFCPWGTEVVTRVR